MPSAAHKEINRQAQMKNEIIMAEMKMLPAKPEDIGQLIDVYHFYADQKNSLYGILKLMETYSGSNDFAERDKELLYKYEDRFAEVYETIPFLHDSYSPQVSLAFFLHDKEYLTRFIVFNEQYKCTDDDIKEILERTAFYYQVFMKTQGTRNVDGPVYNQLQLSAFTSMMKYFGYLSRAKEKHGDYREAASIVSTEIYMLNAFQKRLPNFVYVTSPVVKKLNERFNLLSKQGNFLFNLAGAALNGVTEIISFSFIDGRAITDFVSQQRSKKKSNKVRMDFQETIQRLEEGNGGYATCAQFLRQYEQDNEKYKLVNLPVSFQESPSATTTQSSNTNPVSQPQQKTPTPSQNISNKTAVSSVSKTNNIQKQEKELKEDPNTKNISNPNNKSAAIREYERAEKDYEEGTQKSLEKAFREYLYAAKLGHIQAQYNVGKMYFEGIGVRENWNDAKEWLDKASEQGFVDADEYIEKNFPSYMKK